MKKLTKAELKEFRDRLYLPIPDADLEGDLPPYYHPGPDSDEIQYMRERRAALGGSLPSRVVRSKPLKQPPQKTFDVLQGRLRQAGGRHHDGVRTPAQGADEGPGAGQALRPDHPGRGPHLRHGLAVPDREDLLAARPALRGRRPRPAAVLPGVHHGRDPARGHQRGRLDGQRHRRRHVVRDARRRR